MLKNVSFGTTEYTFHAVTGVIHGYHKRSDTYVSGSGGGPNNTPVTISSSVNIVSEFHIVDDEGVEHEVRLNGERNVVLREGQTVSMIYSGSLPIAILNHNSQKVNLLDTREHLYTNKKKWHWGALVVITLLFHWFFEPGWGWSIFWGVLLTLFFTMHFTNIVLQPRALARFDAEMMPMLETFLKEKGVPTQTAYSQ